MCAPSPPPPTPSPNPPAPPLPAMPTACGGAPAQYYVSGPYGDMCLTSPASVGYGVNPLTAQPCTGAATQLFEGLDSRGGVISQNTNWCLTMPGFSNTVGNYVELWPCGQPQTEEWFWDDNGHIRLANDLCLTFNVRRKNKTRQSLPTSARGLRKILL